MDGCASGGARARHPASSVGPISADIEPPCVLAWRPRAVARHARPFLDGALRRRRKTDSGWADCALVGRKPCSEALHIDHADRTGAEMSLDLEALETSFDLVAPRGDELMDEFYSRLFAAAPAVRPLFPSDLKKQKTMLLATLVLLRKSLRNLDGIAPKLRELGARHVAYGAKPEHYPVVGATLIASLAAVAGDAWTPKYERAWSAAYELVADAMLEGAEQAALEAAA